MASPIRWQRGWNGQFPPPPGVLTLNGASLVLVRRNGVGPWVVGTYGSITPLDIVLVLGIGTWIAASEPIPSGIILSIP